jgi:hypothetical protein
MELIKFRYIYQHDETGRFMSRIFTLKDIEHSNDLFPAHYIPIAKLLYIGRKDIDGIDIYEGDIVKTNFGQIAEIAWFPLACAFGYKYPEQKYPELFNPDKFKVIGNKFENQELIKQG